jgi:hypothetical protein
MIREIEAREILLREFPDITIALNKNNENIFKLMQSFTSYTKNCALNGNTDRLRSCFRIAENFLRNGNKTVRSAVENCYVYSVSSLLEVYSPVQGLIRKILPMTLKKDCLKHISDINSLNDLKDESCLFREEILNYKGELVEFEPYQPNNKTYYEENIIAAQYFTIQHRC